MNETNQSVVEIDGESYSVAAIKAKVTPVPKPKRVRRGNVVKHEGFLYVVHVSNDRALLVNVMSGSRWNDGVRVGDVPELALNPSAELDLSLILRSMYGVRNAAVYPSLQAYLDEGNALPRH